MLRLLPLFLLLLLTARPVTGQAPLHEARAVWFTTVMRLDGWPQYGGQPASQQEARLRAHIREAKALGINTFVFQVVSRGDAMYPSERLPWSHWLKAAGFDPGYDPLAVAVDEAHRQGMELHAWFNTFRVGDLSFTANYATLKEPGHVYYDHPEWVEKPSSSSDELWLDPSNPEARAWLVGNVVEIVENYDVDAVHFDFIRYPSGGLLGDGQRYQADRRGFGSIDDWRRDNVTQFVKDAYEAVVALKPWVKMGSAPIGNYKNLGRWPGFYGYTDVFQEARLWVQEGYQDYLAPQLYFSLGTTPEGSNTYKSPDFSIVLREWEAESAGRPIYAGIAAYKPAEGRFPASDLPLLIDDAREAGAEGQVFFRFAHLKQYAGLITPRYPTPALLPVMAHRWEASAPSAPGAPAIYQQDGRTVEIVWRPSEGSAADPLRGYAVFRKEGAPPDVADPADLHAVLGDTVRFVDVFDETPDQPFHYRVVAQSRLGMVSDGSEAVSTAGLSIGAEDAPAGTGFRLEAAFPNPAFGELTIRFEVDGPSPVRLAVFDALGREVSVLLDGVLPPGRHAARFSAARLSPGPYFIALVSGSRRLVEPVIVR